VEPAGVVFGSDSDHLQRQNDRRPHTRRSHARQDFQSGAITRWDDPAITRADRNHARRGHPRHPTAATHPETTDNFQQYLQAAALRRRMDQGRRQSIQGEAWENRRPRQRGHVGGLSRKRRAAIGYNECRTHENRTLAGNQDCGPESFASETTGSARPSRTSPSKATATTLCSTSRRSTPPLRPAPTPSCWRATKSPAPLP